MTPTSREVISSHLAEVLEQELLVDPSKVRLDTRFAEDLQLDSLDLIAVINRMEELFGIQVPDSSVREITTVRTCIEVVATRLASAV